MRRCGNLPQRTGSVAPLSVAEHRGGTGRWRIESEPVLGVLRGPPHLFAAFGGLATPIPEFLNGVPLPRVDVSLDTANEAIEIAALDEHAERVEFHGSNVRAPPDREGPGSPA